MPQTVQEEEEAEAEVEAEDPPPLSNNFVWEGQSDPDSDHHHHHHAHRAGDEEDSENEFAPLPGVFSRSRFASDGQSGVESSRAVSRPDLHISSSAVPATRLNDDPMEPVVTMEFDFERCRRMARQHPSTEVEVCSLSFLLLLLLSCCPLFFFF